MKLSVDRQLCMSTALCTGIAPDALAMNGDGSLLVLVETPGADIADDVHDAVRMCPVQALVLEND